MTTTAPVRTINPSRSGITPWKTFKTDPRQWFGDEEIDKSIRYVKPKRRVNAARIALNVVVDLVVIRTHLIPNILDGLGWNNWFLELLVAMAVLMGIGVVLNSPFGWWEEMVYDKRWELSKMTATTFFTDLAKNLVLGIVMNSLIFGVLWWIIRGTDSWWLLGWGAVALLSVGYAVIYVKLVKPIFNKFTPMEEGELHESILAVAREVGADITKVEIEDTSKRETRVNAYVGGMGKARRMVVCDTMLEWPHDEIRWVCAHEIGHWKLRHMIKTVPIAVGLLLIDFIAIKLLLSNDAVLRFAGVDAVGDPGALPLFMFVFPLPGMLTGLLGMFFSRHNEREADLFGLEAVPDPASASASFRHLVSENIGDLTPSAWRRLTHSHPHVSERLAMIEAWDQRNGATTAVS